MLEILFCLVVGVTDGDTLKARCGEPGSYEEVRIRLVAIDAPEKRQDFGNRSRQHLSDLCFQADAKITIYYLDRYGRSVANVECNGKDAGAEQVRAGMAWVWDRYAKDHQYLYPLQEDAKMNRRGLWSMPNPQPPWEFRRNR